MIIWNLKAVLQCPAEEDLEFEGSRKAASEAREKHDLRPKDISSLHSFLFDEKFMTVDMRGHVSILSIPVLSFVNGLPCIQELENIVSNSRSLHEDRVALPQEQTSNDSPMRKSMPDLLDVEFSPTHLIQKATPMRKTATASPTVGFSPQLSHFIEKGSPSGKSMPVLPDMGSGQPLSHFIEKLSPMRNSMPDHPDIDFGLPFTRFSGNGSPMRKPIPDLPDMEFSPRLTHLIEKGIVPESPTVNSNLCPTKVATSSGPVETVEKIVSPVSPNDELPLCSQSLRKIDIERGEKTPVTVHSKNSSSEGWRLGSAEALKSVHRTPKFKRLRRHRDSLRKLPCKVLEENFHSQVKQFCQRTSQKKLERSKKVKGKLKFDLFLYIKKNLLQSPLFWYVGS